MIMLLILAYLERSSNFNNQISTYYPYYRSNKIC